MPGHDGVHVEHEFAEVLFDVLVFHEKFVYGSILCFSQKNGSLCLCDGGFVAVFEINYLEIQDDDSGDDRLIDAVGFHERLTDVFVRFLFRWSGEMTAGRVDDVFAEGRPVVVGEDVEGDVFCGDVSRTFVILTETAHKEVVYDLIIAGDLPADLIHEFSLLGRGEIRRFVEDEFVVAFVAGQRKSVLEVKVPPTLQNPPKHVHCDWDLLRAETSDKSLLRHLHFHVPVASVDGAWLQPRFFAVNIKELVDVAAAGDRPVGVKSQHAHQARVRNIGGHKPLAGIRDAGAKASRQESESAPRGIRFNAGFRFAAAAVAAVAAAD